jgi:hypothetical protein
VKSTFKPVEIFSLYLQCFDTLNQNFWKKAKILENIFYRGDVESF